VGENESSAREGVVGVHTYAIRERPGSEGIATRVIRHRVQTKPLVSTPGDAGEREADRIAAGFSLRSLTRSEEKRPDARPAPRIEPGSSGGTPLDATTNRVMQRYFGYDFSQIRIHADDDAAALSQSLSARAFTYGSDVFFNKGEYDPRSEKGSRLLAHELTHVVQQSRVAGGTVQPKLIQRTTVGEILDEFFAVSSSPTLWVMPASDNYTRIVQRWQPVRDAVAQAKADVETNCSTWDTSRRTTSSWRPGMTNPPVADPNAHAIWVHSPPGTDPTTCRNAFIVYKASGIQTFDLYTCSIGSFGIYVTVNNIDCVAKTAELNIWMYNAMSRRSFGRFAQYFPLSGMETQYMWWNWTVPHSWGSAAPPVAPPSGGGSRW
jgi:hypothetical protein